MGKSDKSKRKSPVRVKRKRNQNDTDFLNSIQVPLTNRFNALNEGDNNIAEDDSSPKKITVSPIVITDHSTNIDTITKELKIDCQPKILSIGRKNFCKSIEDKNKLIKALKTQKHHFFSHPENENKVFKAILTGLPQIEIKEITDCLTTEHQISPSKVIMFNTNSPNKTYLCHFNKSDVDMKKLNTIKVIYHHIVNWLPFKPKQRGPTQFFRCCMYGHGASTCNRYIACLLCSGAHETKLCPQQSAQSPVYKCYNCFSANLNHNHKATDPDCPFRSKYELARNNMREKSKRNTLNQTIASSGPHKQKYIIAPTPAPLTVSFASQLASSSRSAAHAHPQRQQQTQSSSPFVSSHSQRTFSNNNSNGLFTIEELTDILFNSINELEKCTSKFDQLRVITNILRNVCK